MQLLYGYFLGSWTMGWVLLSTVLFLSLGYNAAPLFVWTLYFALVLVGFQAPLPVLIVSAALATFFLLKPLRRFLSRMILYQMQKMKLAPKISETERAALDAGTVWIEKDIFSGAPNFRKLMHKPYPDLTEEERNFLEGPVEKLCQMIDDWKIWHDKKIPDNIWEFLKKEKFLGIIVPKKYGGLDFSAHAHSEIIMKINSRSIPVAISTMVPNSLGPAELLIHYGTEEQKNNYLPKLASGEEIPCFALTEPGAGSDAGSLEAEGILFKGTDGHLYIKLNWNKRWITLSGIATVVGLAFRLKDPDRILGDKEDLGITCALIPGNAPGVIKDRRHDPMGIPFINCPIQGKDVVVAADKAIIGGLANAGQGWKMLMECLAAGRGISLPAQATSGAKLATRVAGAHAAVRKQFGIPIGKFEGVTEALGRLAGLTYIIESLRTLTTGALNQGTKPPVVTAITKYYTTELGRKVASDAMDIMGGAAISRGPRNVLANHYMSCPVGITVEGANILTRTLIIFGQGLFRAHPYAYALVKALESGDAKAFDRALWGQVGHTIHNFFRAPLLSLTRGRLYRKCPKQNRRHFQKLAWSSASFALTTNLAMMLVGPALKFKESLSGRFADLLAWNYIGFAVLHRYAAQGFPKEDQVFVDWSMKYVFAQMQEAFDGIFANLKFPGLSWFFKYKVGFWSRLNTFESKASDALTFKLAELIMRDSECRDRLTQGIFIPHHRNDTLGRVEFALKMTEVEARIEKKIKDAIKNKQLPKLKVAKLGAKACEMGIITKDELRDLNLAKDARWEAIQVDDFSEEEYRGASEYKAPSLHKVS